MSLLDLLDWAWRVIVSLLGAVLLYAGIFLLPAEQKQAQSTLENWWTDLRGVQDKALSLQLAFLRKIAATAAKGFEWLFGGLLSVRFFVVSGLFSMGSFVLGMLTFGDYGWAVPTGLILFAFGTAWVALVGAKAWRDVDAIQSAALKTDTWSEPRLSVFSRFEAAPAKPSWWQQSLTEMNDMLPSYLPVIVLGSSGSLVLKGALDKHIGGFTFGMAIFVSFLCDLLAIGVTIFVLNRVAQARSSISAVAWLLLDAVVAAAMVGLPWMAYAQMSGGETPVRVFFLFVAASNISTALPAAVYLLVAICALSHFLLWPTLLRPLYNLVIDSKALAKRKTLCVSGLALLGLCWPHLPHSLVSMVKGATELL